MSASEYPWAQKLAATVKLAREMTGMGLREYARWLGMNQATLHRIEHAKGCDVVALVKIHERTGIKYETLLGAKNGERP